MTNTPIQWLQIRLGYKKVITFGTYVSVSGFSLVASKLGAFASELSHLWLSHYVCMISTLWAISTHDGLSGIAGFVFGGVFFWIAGSYFGCGGGYYIVVRCMGMSME
ncbi:hypothetical protein QBC45DRAFT_105223 [Copromyces sp. CBS 386.78]|nr:hypothetical protein QBC45DRAFT_105223 [Copromyces sp. CBS 386.78]